MHCAGVEARWILRSAQSGRRKEAARVSGRKNKKDEAPKELRPAKSVSLKRWALSNDDRRDRDRDRRHHRQSRHDRRRRRSHDRHRRRRSRHPGDLPSDEPH